MSRGKRIRTDVDDDDVLLLFDSHKFTYAEMAEGLNIKLSTLLSRITYLRKTLGVERMPLRRKGERVNLNRAYVYPTEILERIAELWREGYNEEQIMNDPVVAPFNHADFQSIVQCARRRLGDEELPKRIKKKMRKKKRGYYTMSDINRTFVRRVGNEFIFRDLAGHEELWVRGENGVRWLHGNTLILKENMR